jgi:hypothetical protein
MKVNHLFLMCVVSMELQKKMFLEIFEGKNSGFSLCQKAVGRWLVRRLALTHFLLGK